MLSSIYENITQIFLFQNAIGVILDTIDKEVNSHAACIITNDVMVKDQTIINSLRLNEFPSITCDCGLRNNESKYFVNQMQESVTIGCSFFVASEMCVVPFLDNFQEIHDWVEQRYEKKILVVIDTQNGLTFDGIMDILSHGIVINEIPLTLILQPNVANDWIDIWSAFPYNSNGQIYNRFFLSNFSFQLNKRMIPKITDMNGLRVTGALIHYPPYTGYFRVNPGEGNADLFNSNESRSVQLDGQEHLILVELCVKYNCTLTARLDYDEELWGESFDNHTGTGLIGSLVTRDANVTCAAVYFWDNTYKFSQYSAMIQRASITHIVPKPLPLPYWQTPILPFPPYIWKYVIGAFLICAVVLFIVNAIQLKIEQEERITTYGLFDSIYAVFMMSIFQGVNIDIKFLSNITIFTVILIYALIIGNLYAGGLSSVMTVTRYEEPVDTLEKLVKSNFVWGTTALSWIFAIKQSDYPPHKIYVSKYLVKTVPDVLELVQQRKMAVMLESLQHGTLSYQPYIDEPSSRYYMIMKESMYWQGTTFMASKTWPFMEQLNRIVLMQQESGIRYYWERYSAIRLMDYGIQRNIEENAKPPSGGDPVRLSVDHIRGALYLLYFGCIISTIFFVLEIIWHRNKKQMDVLLEKALARVHIFNKK